MRNPDPQDAVHKASVDYCPSHHMRSCNLDLSVGFDVVFIDELCYSNREVIGMATIKPVTDLRNYGEVLRDCADGKPVYLTRNGRGRYVILEIEAYERQQAKQELFAKLAEGEASVRSEADWLSTTELRKKLGV